MHAIIFIRMLQLLLPVNVSLMGILQNATSRTCVFTPLYRSTAAILIASLNPA